MQVMPRLLEDSPHPLVARSDSIQHPGHPAEAQIAISARLLEDLAQTCAVLRSSCLEQADLLRTLTRDPVVLAHLHRADAHLSAPATALAAAGHGVGMQEYSARKEEPYRQQPAALARVLDG